MRRTFTSIMILTLLGILPLKSAIAQSYYDNYDSYDYGTYNNEYFVAANGLRVRSSAQDTGKVMGLLNLNDKVQVTSELINEKFVEIEILNSQAAMLPAEKYFVVKEYLSQKQIDYKEFTGKYFIVVNVATETLRLYERQCLDNSCPNKMIMETEVVVGEDKDNSATSDKGKGRSILGSYRITGWAKFYEDAEKHYPAWYKEGYPMPPELGNNIWRDWGKNKYMPPGVDGETEGKMRGAFGWYAAFVAPHAYGQWTHGTVGWGANKDEYIKKTKKFMINVVTNPRSSGCTRNNNEAIAFLRQLTETGTPIIKIYAREAMLDTSYRGATRSWQYVLTKKAGQRADRADVVKALGVTDADVSKYWNARQSGGGGVIDPASTLNQILEVGTYSLDTQPTVYPFTPRKKIFGKWRATGRNGNVYGLKEEEMSPGVYYVDAGFLNGYRHPYVTMQVSGFMDEETPPWMRASLLKRY